MEWQNILSTEITKAALQAAQKAAAGEHCCCPILPLRSLSLIPSAGVEELGSRGAGSVIENLEVRGLWFKLCAAAEVCCWG